MGARAARKWVSHRRPPARRAILLGGGVGIAPLAILSDSLPGDPTVLLGFRDLAHSRGAQLLGECRLATDDGSTGHHGPVTDLLCQELDRDPAAVVYACGPAAMLERVRAICAEREIDCQLALEAGMACGFGACFGCVVPRRGGGYLRVCLDGPVLDGTELERVDAARRSARMSVEFCGLRLAHPVINGSGTFDALAARLVFGEALIPAFPFSAYVSKTITQTPREGNPPPRLWEPAGGLINSIGLPNRGLAAYLAHDLPALARLMPTSATARRGCAAARHQRHGLERRSVRPACRGMR